VGLSNQKNDQAGTKTGKLQQLLAVEEFQARRRHVVLYFVPSFAIIFISPSYGIQYFFFLLFFDQIFQTLKTAWT
jgi:hypothetical protein